MNAKEKLIKQFKAQALDFTFDSCSKLLKIFHCQKNGMYSSSLVFKRENSYPIMIHKPHSGKCIKLYAMKQMSKFLEEIGYIK